MQHMCAVMLEDGIVTFASAHDEKRMKHPRTLVLRKRIELLGDEEMTRALPARQGIVELKLRDGRALRHHTKAVRGTAQNPMSRAEVDEKAYHLMAPVLGKARARALCGAAWTLDRLPSMRKLRQLVRA
jgi:2-methylcitrate dehydratase PrpD